MLAAIKESWREDRKPADILLVLDTSGSMNDENRLARAKDGLEVFFDQIAPQDSVGLVTFSDVIRPLLPIRPFKDARAELERTVRDLFADGGTAFYDATAQAYDSVREEAGRRAHQRGRAAHRRRGHRLHHLAGRRSCSDWRRAPRAPARCACSRSPTAPARRARRSSWSDRQGVRRPGLRRATRTTSSPSTARSPRSSDAMAERPYDRAQYNRALIANALLDPFTIVLVGARADRGDPARRAAYLLPVAAAASTWAARRAPTSTRTPRRRCSSASARKRRRARSGGGQAAGPRAAGAADRAPRAGGAGARGTGSATRSTAPSCPTTRSPTEVDGFVVAMDRTAGRAQLLYEALADTPPDGVARRLEEVRGDPGRAELAEALTHAARHAAPDGGPAPALLRRARADAGRARHGPLPARLGLGQHRVRARRPSWPARCARCASAWAPSPTACRPPTRAPERPRSRSPRSAPSCRSWSLSQRGCGAPRHVPVRAVVGHDQAVLLHRAGHDAGLPRAARRCRRTPSAAAARPSAAAPGRRRRRRSGARGRRTRAGSRSTVIRSACVIRPRRTSW